MYKLHKSKKEDLEKIAECHSLCFQDSLSTKIGKTYTIKTFEWFLASDKRFLFQISKDDEVIGYCGGFTPQFIGDGSTSGMLQFAMHAAIKGVLKKPSLLFHVELAPFYPLIIKNICKRIFVRNRNASVETKKVVTKRKAGLVVIGVHPEYRGKKVFELLMNTFEKEAMNRYASTLYLSVKKDNERAMNAYKKAGWRISNEHETSFEMEKTIEKISCFSVDEVAVQFIGQ